MIYKILITLKDSGKVVEILVEKTEDNEVLEISQTTCHIEWLVIKGFTAHPLKVNKTIGIRSREIAGIEMEEAEDWFVKSAENFKQSLDEIKDESQQ